MGEYRGRIIAAWRPASGRVLADAISCFLGIGYIYSRHLFWRHIPMQNRLQQIYEALKNEYLRGCSAFYNWDALKRQFASNCVGKNKAAGNVNAANKLLPLFRYGGILDSFQQVFEMALAKLTDKDTRTASLHNFVIAAYDAKHINCSERRRLEKRLNHEIFRTVRKNRNKLWAHIDINGIYRGAVVKEYEKAYKICEQVLNFVAKKSLNCSLAGKEYVRAGRPAVSKMFDCLRDCSN